MKTSILKIVALALAAVSTHAAPVATLTSEPSAAT